MATAKHAVSWGQIIRFKLRKPFQIRATTSSKSSKKIDIYETKVGKNTKQLNKLDSYFNKLNFTTSNGARNFGEERQEKDQIDTKILKNANFSPQFVQLKTTQNIRNETEDSDFSLINLLAGINIAILFFEIASPIRSLDFEYISLPLFYGAKINKLILLGEWWRLLTPMFLHSGLLHVAVGCWALLTIGPKVCKAYGPITFLLIYLLGGLCGNFTSFLHTPELTVCGTGPVFGIIGAWFIYQVQNKEAISKNISENVFNTAVIITILTFILSSFGRIDNWTHIGAIISGIIFGYFTCPSLEIDNSNSTLKDGKKEGFVLLQKSSNPCKSIAIFSLFIFLLSAFVFLYGMQIEMFEFE